MLARCLYKIKIADRHTTKQPPQKGSRENRLSFFYYALSNMDILQKITMRLHREPDVIAEPQQFLQFNEHQIDFRVHIACNLCDIAAMGSPISRSTSSNRPGSEFLSNQPTLFLFQFPKKFYRQKRVHFETTLAPR